MEGRIQKGNMHVYFRGNHRCNVFYDDLDRYMFLKKCGEASEKFNTKILEFAIMDNHVHLQIITECVTKFMRYLLYTYSRWYNQKYGIKGQLFCSPFNSAVKRSNEWIINSMLYILQNPLVTGVYRHPKDFYWSSFLFHFNCRTPLRKHISVDTSIMDNFFGTKFLLEKAILQTKTLPPNIKEDKELDKISNSELLKIVQNHSNKHSIYGMDQDKLKILIKDLFENTPATILQIVTVTHTNDQFVKETCRSLRR